MANSNAQPVNLGPHFIGVHAEFLGYGQGSVAVNLLVLAALQNFSFYGVHAGLNYFED
jgi:hypothetical protein